ncbi:hypothetical protein DM860_008463 [Cuscuta australis]|uniref:Uncharacterized protein n=1 Tax=Cuscuta australis TaxID=267555 RepID=A0A328D508_9ASTE|nr:hypothetical protein DM860_008463 [Cuscuta australis]
MANPAGIGTKFASVNLNRSYGQPHQYAHQSYSGSFGQAGNSHGGRAASGGGGGGGGMVVLSRPKSSQKAGPKLSVPPPLNLPSLRKEHQKFDVSGSVSGATSGGRPASGPRPSSSGVGWSKPAPAVGGQGKDGTGDTQVVEDLNDTGYRADGLNRHVNGAYMPPSARPGGIGSSLTVSTKHLPPPTEKAGVLRGEDFPSLQAALPIPSVSSQKQKEVANPKQKFEEEYPNHRSDNFGSVGMHPHGHPSRQSFENRPAENDVDCIYKGRSSQSGHSWKQEEYLTGPLPLVQITPRSDWADDERDTGHGFMDRDRDSRMVKSENYWNSDFDIPRISVLPHKLANSQYERRGERETETGIVASSEVLRGGDAHHRDVRTDGREGSTWKSSSIPRDGNVPVSVNSRNGVNSRTYTQNKDMGKDSKYAPPQSGETANCDSAFAKKEAMHSSEVQKQWNNSRESYQSNRFGLQNSNGFKPSFASSGKSLSVSNAIPNLGREKHAFSRNEKPYVEDFGAAGFDERDILSGGLVGVIKRKKDVIKQIDFHDPVRESFEAELERVQKMQELERQRIIEEQERALEQAQKEEEERQRVIREEAEQRRRLEEEAREAAWREEQEKLEAIRKADEQRAAREEERRRIFLEEERRKQAAKQKLLELEAKIAKREADRGKTDISISTTVFDEKLSLVVKESEASDLDNWDESERMVERLTTSTYSETPALSGTAEIGFRPYHSRDGYSDFGDAGKSTSSWRRDAFGTGSCSRVDPDFCHGIPRRDASARGVGVAPQKDLYGGSGYMSSRSLIMKDGVQEAFTEEFGEPKEDRWRLSADVDPFNRTREFGSEYQDNFGERYSDIGWGQGHSHGGSSRFPYPGQSYPNPETDDHFSYGKSRYSMRQPRVLPPPTLSTTHRNFSRGENELARTSGFVNTQSTENYDGHVESRGTPLIDLQHDNTSIEETLRKDMGSRCDSQSSLSVTSPPISPPHLSNDEMDESGYSPVVSTAAGGQNIIFSGHKCPVLNDVSIEDATRTVSSSISVVEDEEWTIENNDDLPQQEEYDDEEDGFREEDELHEGDDNIELNQEFEGLNLGESISSPNSNNIVLGFNEGVEVAIPSDDFEKDLRNEEIFDRAETYVHSNIPEEQGAMNDVQVDELCCQPAECSSQLNSRSKNEMAVQETVRRPAIVPHNSTTSVLSDGVDVPSCVLSSAHQSLSPVHNPSSATSQADLPVKLQFGLFSGPSLIPSPVPAIQIGSIQMPLHLHPSQPSFFQFGQFRYSPPTSQGVSPGLSFIQPNLQNNNHNVYQCDGGSLRTQQHGDDVSSGKLAEMPSLSLNKQTGSVTGSPVQSHGNVSGISLYSVRAAGNNAQTCKIISEVSGHTESNLPEKACFRSENKLKSSGDPQNNLCSSKGKIAQPVRRMLSGRFKPQGSFTGSKGKRFTYAVKNSSARPSSHASETSYSNIAGFQKRPRRTIQRTEFRIRENGDKRQLSALLSGDDNCFDDNATYTGRYGGGFPRNGSKRGSVLNKSMKCTVESENYKSPKYGSQNFDSGKDHALKNQSSLCRFGEGNLKRNISEDVDAPLQSGIVRVFKQPGIEAPSDEDDFIQVRSKRQMLNDRREQREKEIKAKSRALKQPRKPYTPRQNIAVSTSLNKASVHAGGKNPQKTQSVFVATEGQGSTNISEPMGCSTDLQSVVPPCTPAKDVGTESDIRSIKSHHASSATVVSGAGCDGTSLMFEGNKPKDAIIATSLESWCPPCVNQQVLNLTQSQLEEAMKSVKFETHVSSSVSHSSSSVSEPALPSSSTMMPNDKSFTLTTSPINSLLAGEKIQFGAVTSPTVLPATCHIVSHGIGAPGSKRSSDLQIPHNHSATKSDCSLFDKLPNDSSVSLHDSETEAEAAASAVAVAAITNEEGAENDLGSVAASETKSVFEGDPQVGSQSRVEEPLTVSLPADLSVENHPISLWPRLPDPQNQSGQILSHFPGGQPSHFPFYEMNPVLGGPIFSFGPQEESTVSQNQPQKSTTIGSGPLGAWQQCHSSMDSFYGPPTGFTGPLYSPTGRMPGVQGPPPHMVVYNHFAPFGQFGQVGLSFMGTTYITSGKHNPSSSMGGMSDGDMNISSTQRNASEAPVQHLAPGSPLIPMGSPLAMFDVSPFQRPPPDMHWSSVHSAPPPLHSAPSQPLQQVEVIPPAPLDHGRHPVGSRFPPDALSTSTPPESCPTTLPVSSSVNNDHNNINNSPTAQFPDQLGGPLSDNPAASANLDDAGKSGNNNNSDINRVQHTTSSGVRMSPLPRHEMNLFPSHHHHQSHSSGYNSYHRGMASGMSQRNHEWSRNRRTGFHGRNQSFGGAEKGFSSTRVKQIYVAKQSNGAGGAGASKTEG